VQYRIKINIFALRAVTPPRQYKHQNYCPPWCSIKWNIFALRAVMPPVQTVYELKKIQSSYFSFLTGQHQSKFKI
jgi:hypothetical protein